MHQCFQATSKTFGSIVDYDYYYSINTHFLVAWESSTRQKFFVLLFITWPVLLQSRLCQRAHQCACIAGASAINFLRAVEFLSLLVISPFFYPGPSSYLICICDSCKINGHIYTIQLSYDQSHACFNIRNTVHRCKESFVFGKSLLNILKMKMLRIFQKISVF